MTPSNLTTLKAALKILKKGHKPCKDFNLKCYNCHYTLLVNFLDDEIYDLQWEANFMKKKI